MQYKLLTIVVIEFSLRLLIIIFMPFDIVGRSISNVKYSESATGA